MAITNITSDTLKYKNDSELSTAQISAISTTDMSSSTITSDYTGTVRGVYYEFPSGTSFTIKFKPAEDSPEITLKSVTTSGGNGVCGSGDVFLSGGTWTCTTTGGASGNKIVKVIASPPNVGV